MKRKKYILLFGMSWFIFTTFCLIPFMYKFYEFPGRLTMEEHWIYFPSVGFFVVAAYLLLIMPISKIGRNLIISTIIIILSILTVANNFRYKDQVDFYRYNLRFADPSATKILRFALSDAFRVRSRYQQAQAELMIILSSNPDDWLAYVKLGNVLRKTGRYQEAEQAYRDALKIDPFCRQANRALRSLAKQTSRDYKQELDPALSPIEAEVISLIKFGEYARALDVLDYELSISPNPKLYTLAGITFGKLGLYREAIKEFNSALILEPQYYNALNNLSVVYRRIGEHKKADRIKSMIEVSQYFQYK
jgi:tetratricopeptide (TPR) repeat protein